MSTMQGPHTAITAFVTVLTFALVAPVAVSAEDQVLTEEQGLAAEEQDAALAPAVPSWDEASGYGSVEASRAANALAALPVVITTQVPSDVRWAPDTGPAWLAASRAAAARRAAPAFPEWDAARWSPVEPSQATSPDYIPAALASGQRPESAHLATVPLPGEAAVDGALAEC
jgi:hypothetical protein